MDEYFTTPYTLDEYVAMMNDLNSRAVDEAEEQYYLTAIEIAQTQGVDAAMKWEYKQA